MVDIGGKKATKRHAVAAGRVTMNRKTFELIKSGGIKKGDVLGVARIAGIQAAKKTSEIIPLAHPLPIDKIELQFKYVPSELAVEIICTAGTTGKTGVEMEALTGVAAAALTIYDMCKAADKGIIINNIRLLEKSGGKSGTFILE